jgi:hypothetical protein
MARLRTPFQLLGRTRNRKSTADDKEQEQGKRGQGSNVLTPQECESLQLALENGNRSPHDKQVVEEQVSRLWGATKGASLCVGALSRGCTDADNAKPYSAFVMYFCDGIPTVNFEEERDNMCLLLGSLREDDMIEEGWQMFEDRMSLLNESSFGGGPMIGYDMDTLDPGDLGDDNNENSSSEQDESSSILASPNQSVIYSTARPTDSVVMAALLQLEALQPNSPRCQNMLPLDIYRMKRIRDKLLAQKRDSVQRRAEAKRVRREIEKKEFQRHMVSNGLGTVVEQSFEDERTIASGVKSRSSPKSRTRSPAKSRPRPPPIRTLILDCEVYQQHNVDDTNPECDISRTASTGSSGDPIVEEVGSNTRPRLSAIKALILRYEEYHRGKKYDENAECDTSQTVSTGSSSGYPILGEDQRR